MIIPASAEDIQIELDRRACGRSFAEFVRRGWHVLEPATQLKWGWALDAICDHLTAVTDGEIIRLLMNVPPGSMKSLLVNVFWPAWEWGPRQMPWLKYLGTAHKEPLAIRDNLKCRRLIQSDWYQKRWPVKLTSDQNEKKKFENAATGIREAMAFTSMTGSRGDRVMLDDPHSVDDANSPVELENAATTFREALPSRVNNDASAIIVIMQRLNENDISGVIIAEELGYVHLMLPMRFEPERRCRTRIGFVDPRREDGELMFPDRFPESQVAELERTMKTYAVAGQLQQRPVPREGGMFLRDWFNFVRIIPDRTKFVRGWDLAGSTHKRSDRTAGVLMGMTPEGRTIIVDAVAKRLRPGGVRKLIKVTAQEDQAKYARVRISLPQDPAQAGKDQKESYAVTLNEFDVRFSLESSDKASRAELLSAQAEAGMVDILVGPWNGEFLDEVCNFPNAKHDDYVDGASRAYTELVRYNKIEGGNVGAGPKVIEEGPGAEDEIANDNYVDSELAAVQNG